MEKKKRVIYIAGSISSDIADHGYLKCYHKFEKIEKFVKLNHVDAKIYNPMKFCKADWGWLRCMGKCLFVLVFKCTHIFLMPDHQKSKGAMIEKRVAQRFNLKIIEHDEK